MTKPTKPGRETLVLTFSIPPGADDVEIAKKIEQLAVALDELHKASGGEGLELVKTERRA